MKKVSFLLLMVCGLAFTAGAQSYAWGVKGGLTIGTQRWNGFSSRTPMYKYHGMLFIETAEDEKFSLFAQAGYNPRGSAVRSFPTVVNVGGQNFNVSGSRWEYLFHNISLTAGGKQRFDFGEKSKWYYALGIRGDYTVKTNLPSIADFNGANQFYGGYFPVSDFVRRWNFGVMIGAGLEFRITDLIGTFVEFTVNPDLSRQYYEPPIPNVRIFDYNTGQFQVTTIPEQSIRNLSLELTLGFRFLRKIEYVD